jgi:hypothetical protein
MSFGLGGFRVKSNNKLSRAQFVPNTPRNRALAATRGQPFPLHVSKPPSHSLWHFAFQAGHASSILVTRSIGKALVKGPFCNAAILLGDSPPRAGHYVGQWLRRYQMSP